MIKNTKGVVLISVYLVIIVLLIIGAVFVMRAISDARIAIKELEQWQAFYLAEAAIDRALAQLPANTANALNVALGSGRYDMTITTITVGKKWQAQGIGYIPDKTNPRATVRTEAIIEKKDPPNFYGNAIYTAGDVDIRGSAYDVNGNVIFAGNNLIGDPSFVSGTVTDDESISPLARLDFQQLRTWAMGQVQGGHDNLYTAAEIAAGTPPLPTSFWFRLPGTNGPTDLGEPNVVYIETDLTLRGSVGTIGGFLLVVGDVITNPGATMDTTINGNGMIDGCVYTTGYFRVNGGGGGLNVNGGVWSGNDGVRLNGNVTVDYNQQYQDAIRLVISPSTDTQLISWRQI